MSKKKPIHKRIKRHHVYGLAVVAIVMGIAISSFGYLSNSTTVSAQCAGVGPGQPTNVVAVSGPNKGQVTLHWNDVQGADNYSINYGTQSNKYAYGVAQIPPYSPAQSMTVSNLSSGTDYFFRVTASRSCNPGLPSAQVSAFAK